HRLALQTARETIPYLAVGEQIESALTPGAVILGSERWWPALKEHPYLAINTLWAQWRLDDANNNAPDFHDQVKAASAEFIIVNNNIRDELPLYSPRLQTQFQDLLARCSIPVANWTDTNYGRIEIYQLTNIPNC
ncbi:MAG: hypothetical protein WAM60_19550, partial [Candidatus Promineifilaceae bacterium]